MWCCWWVLLSMEGWAADSYLRIKMGMAKFGNGTLFLLRFLPIHFLSTLHLVTNYVHCILIPTTSFDVIKTSILLVSHSSRIHSLFQEWRELICCLV